MAFGQLERARPHAPMSEINVTPLVDVMLVLLVIFIITAPLMAGAIRLDLPRAEGTQPGAAPQFVTLAVDPAGGLFLDQQPVTEAQLAARLAQAAVRDADTELQLRADARVPYGRVVELMGIAQKAGLARIGFVADPPPTSR